MSGDITISNAGVAAIAAGVIVDADVNAGAAIAFSKMAALTANRIVASNGSGVVSILDTATYPSLTELSYVKGVTSSLQTQIDSKLSVTLAGVTSGDVISYNGAAWVNTPSSGTGIPTAGTTNQILRKIDNTNYNAEWHTLVAADLTDVSSSAAELNKLTGVTTTATQFNFSNTFVGDIQSQINAKLSSSLTTNSMWIGVAGVAGELAAGANGYVLTSVSGLPTWAAPGSGGTVTSVAGSGGTTGMSFTGSPIITSGTLTLTGTLIAANGGTGFASYAVGDLLQATTTTTFAKLASVSAGSFLRSAGVTTASTWSTVKLPDTMSALGVWVANSLNTTVNLTAAANQSIRVNSGGTAWEAYTPFQSTSGNWSMGGSATTFTLGGGATASEIRFLEPSGGGSSYVGFKAPALAGNITFTLPPAFVAGGVLTDVVGDGVLTMVAGSVIGPAFATDNALVRFDGATGKLVQDSGATIDDSGNITASSFALGAYTASSSALQNSLIQNIAIAASSTGFQGFAIPAYGNNTVVYAQFIAIAVKSDGSTGTTAIVNSTFRKNGSGTWSVDVAGTSTTSDATVIATIAGAINGGVPGLDWNTGAYSGTYTLGYSVRLTAHRY